MLFEDQAVYRREQREKRLLNTMLNQEELKPRLTISKLAALGLALLIHAVWMAAIVVGIRLCVGAFPQGRPAHLDYLLAAACLFVLAAFLLPRPVRLRDEELLGAPLPHESYPVLYKLADDVAQQMGQPPVNGIVPMLRFNAGYRATIPGGKRYVLLGVPLWALLTGQERVALLGHELAHGANGDFSRQYMLYSALAGLNRLYTFFAPYWVDRSTATAIRGLISNIALVPLLILQTLLLHESRRAEYLADALAATAGGSVATKSFLGKLHYGAALFPISLRCAEHQQPDQALTQFKAFVASGNVPGPDMEALARKNQAQAALYDLAHPPTRYRMQFQEHRPAEPSIVLDATTAAALDQECAAWEAMFCTDVVHLLAANRRKLRALLG